MERLLLLLLTTILAAMSTDAFAPASHHRLSRNLVVRKNSESEEAAALTDYLAKAHEEKIRAMADVEAKYKSKIEELEAKIQTLEESNNSYAFPATNKDLTEKIRSYQSFISDYIVRAQEDKLKAVREAEAKVKAKYEQAVPAE